MYFGFSDYGLQAADLRREHPAAERGESKIAAARIVMRRRLRRFLHQSLGHELVEVVVKCAGAEFVLALRLAGDLLHDPVTVPVFTGQGEQNVERRRG